MMLYRWLLLIWVLGGMNLSYAELVVTIKPQPAYVNQELVIMIRQQGNRAPASLPDLSMLSRDFQIVGSQQSMAYQNYNGQILRENIWSIVLIPKYPGQFTLPSLNVGGETSMPQNIEVLPLQASTQPQPQAQVDSTPGVFMQWALEPNKASVHQQIKMKIQIYHATPLMDAKLSSPQVENALLFNLDEPSHRIEVVKGRRYEVETYEYLVFPQKEGELTIQPPVLDALEYEFMPNPIHIKLPPKTIEVLASHAQALKDLRFRYLKSGAKTKTIDLGDTLTREFEIEAQGLPYQMMPTFSASCGKDCKVYVQNTENKNIIQAGDVIGRQRFSISYLPQKSGQVKIQDIIIPWLNSQSQKHEQLVIPGMQIMIKANPIAQDEAAVVSVQSSENKQTHSWRFPDWLLILTGLIVGMLFTQVLKGITWSKFKVKIKRPSLFGSPIKRACQQNSASDLRAHLIVWAKKRFPQASIHDLHDIVDLAISPEFKRVLNDLIEYLYGRKQQQNTWDGQHFWHIFSQFERKRKDKNPEKNHGNRLNPD